MKLCHLPLLRFCHCTTAHSTVNFLQKQRRLHSKQSEAQATLPPQQQQIKQLIFTGTDVELNRSWCLSILFFGNLSSSYFLLLPAFDGQLPPSCSCQARDEIPVLGHCQIITLVQVAVPWTRRGQLSENRRRSIFFCPATASGQEEAPTVGCANNGHRRQRDWGLGEHCGQQPVPKVDCVSPVAGVAFVISQPAVLCYYHNNPNSHNGNKLQDQVGLNHKIHQIITYPGSKLKSNLSTASVSGVTPVHYTPRNIEPLRRPSSRSASKSRNQVPNRVWGDSESPKAKTAKRNLHLPTCPPRAPVILMPLSSKFLRYSTLSLLAQ